MTVHATSGVSAMLQKPGAIACAAPQRVGAHTAVSRIQILAGTTQACKTAQRKMFEALGRFALREASRVAKEVSELSVWGTNIPELDALVHRCSGDDAVVVFAPVC